MTSPVSIPFIMSVIVIFLSISLSFACLVKTILLGTFNLFKTSISIKYNHPFSILLPLLTIIIITLKSVQSQALKSVLSITKSILSFLLPSVQSRLYPTVDILK